MPEGEEYYTKYKNILEQFPRLNQSSILQDIQQKGPIHIAIGKVLLIVQDRFLNSFNNISKISKLS